MDKQYEIYCMTHPLFYDSPQSSDNRTYFPAGRRPLPRGWRRTSRADWIAFRPPHSVLPAQGWKIHVSASEKCASDTLTSVWEYCVPREIPFKIIGSPVDVRLRNMKYAERSSAGKLAAIYPADEATCERVLRELDAELKGAAGPYILSDVRYGAGPLYVRYGGFVERFCRDSDGEPVLAIENPAGDLVPDVRSPVFSVPQWVSLPEFLKPHVAARNSVGFGDMNYDITGALHFSNGGGVYTATDKRDGRKVILKEARPHAGLAGDGSDAVTRLRREYEFMRRLAGLGITAEAYAYFQVGDHHFLAEEFIDGKTFSKCIADRYPLFAPDPDPESLAEFTSWVMRTCAETERAAELMHSRGIVFHDLHTFNVILRPDDTVVLIDFEAASDVGEGRRAGIGNPGFTAPPDRTGFDVDTYALACARLSAFMPLTALLPLDRTKARQIASAIAALFPVPESFLEEAVAEIERGAPPSRRPAASAMDGFTARSSPGGTTPRTPRPDRKRSYGTRGASPGRMVWPRLSHELVTAIRSSATPGRTDRLFPGDIDQFAVPGGGLGLAYGAAGVLYALDEAGMRVPQYEEWLLRRVKNPPTGISPGGWDGLSGIAWVLGRLGYADAATRLADMCLAEKWEGLRPGLFDGLAGFGLAMLGLGESLTETPMAAAGLRAAGMIADATRHQRAGDRDDQDAAGLLRGPAGGALLLIRAYEHTADPGYLDAAATAIAADLSRCVADPNGGLQVDEGYRMLPYLGAGSAGIGLVIDRFLAHRDDPALARAADQIAVAATSTFYVQSGLFTGRAGLLCFLAARDRATPRVGDHVTRLAWHAMPYADGLAFPGDTLLRLSMDLGTGTAGVLLGLAAALAPQGAAVPFLARPTSLPGRDSFLSEPDQGVSKDRELARR